MSNKNNTGGLFAVFSDPSGKYDKGIVISFATACIFILLGLIQVIVVIATPLARTFDHISLIPIDFMIAVFCIVYILYRRGNIAGLSFDDKPAQTTDEAEDKTGNNLSGKKASPEISRVRIPDAAGHSGRQVIRSSSIANSSAKSSPSRAANENLFAPRHRYSRSPASRAQNIPASTKSAERKFNSRRTGR